MAGHWLLVAGRHGDRPYSMVDESGSGFKRDNGVDGGGYTVEIMVSGVPPEADRVSGKICRVLNLFPHSAFPIPNSIEWLCTRRRIFLETSSHYTD